MLTYIVASIKVGMMPQERPCMVSYCFHSSIIPQECGSGIDATIKITQVGSDAASRPMRQRIELAVMPQVKLAVMPQERPCMVSYCFHSSIIPQECGSGIDATIKI
jgi:hypothetical protein